MKTDIDEWLEDASGTVGTNLRELELDSDQGHELSNAVLNRFVDGNPRAWWMSLKEDFEVSRVNIDDSDSELKYRVFKASLDVIISLIRECPFFEYYILPQDISWLVAESDHGQLYLVTESE